MNTKSANSQTKQWLDYDVGNARWQGGEITPLIVVLHDTAGRLEFQNSAQYLLENDVKVSVHFVVERDGSVMQQVALDKAAFHAGKSEYHGRKWVNQFSIGIEIVNPGRMRPAQDDGAYGARAWFGEFFDLQDWDIHNVSTPEHGSGMWLGYTDAQITAVRILLAELFAAVPTLMDIRPHWYISPGRKVDTNPLFPLEEIRTEILGREDPAEDAADLASEEVKDAQEYAMVDVDGDSLNMRRWPSFNNNVITQIPHGVCVPVLRAGEFNGRKWIKVLYQQIEGWIVQQYVAPPPW